MEKAARYGNIEQNNIIFTFNFPPSFWISFSNSSSVAHLRLSPTEKDFISALQLMLLLMKGIRDLYPIIKVSLNVWLPHISYSFSSLYVWGLAVVGITCDQKLRSAGPAHVARHRWRIQQIPAPDKPMFPHKHKYNEIQIKRNRNMYQKLK